MRSWWLRLFSHSAKQSKPFEKPRKSRSGTFKPFVEPLEDRVTPAIDMVTVAGDGGGAGALRYVIAHASSGDTIEFNTSLMGTNVIDLNAGSGSIVIGNENLTIGDSTTASQNIIIDGTGNDGEDGIFELTGTSNVSFSNLTIQNGLNTFDFASGGAIQAAGTGTLTLANDTFLKNSASVSTTALDAAGGAVFNAEGSTLNVQSCLFVNNTATSTGDDSTGAEGGAIYNDGTMTVSESTFTGNSVSNPGTLDAVAIGGAIDNVGGTGTITNSTLSSDTGIDGGAIGNINGTLVLTNSTLNLNTASSDGAGIYNQSSTLNLMDDTISGNSASDAGGGIEHTSGTLTLQDTIVSGNAAGTFADIGGAITTDYGNNLLGTDVDNNTNDPAQGTNDVFSDAPNLSALGYYGGLTQTMALLPGSPAITAGIGIGSISVDQRGFTRSTVATSGTTDIGAFQTEGANTLVVTTTADPGQVAGKLSLREAVNLANAYEAAGDSAAITFSGLDNQTITLTQGQLELKAGTVSGTSTTIDGTDPVTVSGNGTSRVYQIDAGSTVTLSNMIITDGNGVGTTDSGAGGAIASFGILTLSGDTISASSATLGGGGIYVNGGSTTLDNGTVIEDNDASGTGSNGGGILLSAGSLSINNATVSGNTAGQGGGIDVSGGTMTFTSTQSVIENNTATAASAAGGGIFNSATVNVGDGTNAAAVLVENNSANNGSGGWGAGIYNSGTFTLANQSTLTLQGNTATGLGGGVDNSGTFAQDLGATLTVGNSGAGNGNKASQGGGLYNSAGSMTLTNAVIQDNSATISGGGINVSGGSFILDVGTVSGNTASSTGGGLNVTTGSITLTNSTFTGNSAATGGGMNFTSVSGTASLANDTISGNSGGSGVVVGGGNLSLVNDTIAFNTGGGFKRSAGTVTAIDSLFADNPTFGFSGTVSSAGHNLFQDAAVTGSVASDKLSQTSATVLLAPLGNYGGPTETNALLPGSTALDAGADTTQAPYDLSTDQRGSARRVDGGANGVVDIGAYESQGFVLTRTGTAAANAPTEAPAGDSVYRTLIGQTFDNANGSTPKVFEVLVTANDPGLTNLAGGVISFFPLLSSLTTPGADIASATPAPATVTLTSSNTAALTSVTANSFASAVGSFYYLNASADLAANTHASPSTTSTTAVSSSGSTQITPAVMEPGIVLGAHLVIDEGQPDQEIVTVTGMTSNTFTATFANTHAVGFTIDSLNNSDWKMFNQVVVTPSLTVRPFTVAGVGSNTITFGYTTGFVNGEAVVYKQLGGSDISGLTSGDTYYVNAESSTSVQLFATPSLTTPITFGGLAAAGAMESLTVVTPTVAVSQFSTNRLALPATTLTVRDVNVSTLSVTVGSANLYTGQPIDVTSSSIAHLPAAVYYVVATGSGTQIRVATSLANASAGVVISNLGAGTAGVSVPTAENLTTGEPVVYVSGNITGLTAGTTYYAIVADSSGRIGLATSQANALAGTAISGFSSSTSGTLQLPLAPQNAQSGSAIGIAATAAATSDALPVSLLDQEGYLVALTGLSVGLQSVYKQPTATTYTTGSINSVSSPATTTGATATAHISGGKVTSITVANGSSGYLYPPSVVISGGGTGVTVNATATAIINSAGTVTGFTMTNVGSGYTAAPTVTLAARASLATGAGAGAGAPGVAVFQNMEIYQSLFSNLYQFEAFYTNPASSSQRVTSFSSTFRVVPLAFGIASGTFGPLGSTITATVVPVDSIRGNFNVVVVHVNATLATNQIEISAFDYSATAPGNVTDATLYDGPVFLNFTLPMVVGLTNGIDVPANYNYSFLFPVIGSSSKGPGTLLISNITPQAGQTGDFSFSADFGLSSGSSLAGTFFIFDPAGLALVNGVSATGLFRASPGRQQFPQ